MSKFMTAMTQPTFTPSGMTLTENGMLTPSDSGSAVLDLFAKIGASRGLPAEAVNDAFARAFVEDPLLALKTMFYSRDVREGQGERQAFRAMFRFLCEVEPEVANANIPNVPFFGRWDDLLVAVGTAVEDNALAYIAGALMAGDQLCAKWMPREGKRAVEGKRASKEANALRTFLELSWPDYRKLLAGNTKVVESLMCQKRWTEIDYSKVPSQAITRYRKAWYRHDQLRYSAWINAALQGVQGVKINAGAVHPHEVLRPLSQRLFNQIDATDIALVTAQWKAMPDYMEPGRSVLPVCDVSGSMSGLPMEVCLALGLYLSERNVGPFKDNVITFSESPAFFELTGDLLSRVQQLHRAPWGMNTNLEKVFNIVLQRAKAAKLPQADMPGTILILSDMQFDQCVSGATALGMIGERYAAAGYTRPNIVFWNLRASSGSPARADDQGTLLVSGFSPSIMKSVLKAVAPEAENAPTPLAVMLDTLNAERYNRVVVEI
jgi:hypothetical protein